MSCCAWFLYDKVDACDSDDSENTCVPKTFQEKEHKTKKKGNTCAKNVLEVPIRYLKTIASKIKR